MYTLGVGVALWVAGESWRWFAGAPQSTATAFLAVLSRLIRPWSLHQAVLCTLAATLLAALWWGIGKMNNWRRPSVPLAALLTLQFLSIIHLWIPSYPGPPPLPALRMAMAGIFLIVLSLLTAWGAAPGRQLISAEGAPRSAVGFLRRSRIPIQAVGICLMFVAFLLTMLVFLPMYKAPLIRLSQPGFTESMLILGLADVSFLLGRSMSRRTWRAG